MEEEISLRELIEIVLKGKKLIIITTLTIIFIVALLTFIPKRTPQVPQYRAEASIRIEQLALESYNLASRDYFSVLISTLMSAERYNAEVLAELVRHPDLLAAVRRDLLLDERGVPQGFLAKSIETSVDSTKTALTVGLTHTDPDFAMEIVNTVSEEIEEFLAARQRERINLVASNLERFIALELQGLRSALKRLEESRATFDPLITYRDDSHLTPEYAVLSNDIAGIISQISQLEAQQQEIKDFRIVFDSLYHEGIMENPHWLKKQGSFSFIHGDIRNQNDITRLVQDVRPDAVVHLAGQVAMTTSIANPRMDFEVNVVVTHNLLEAVRLYAPDAAVFIHPPTRFMAT